MIPPLTLLLLEQPVLTDESGFSDPHTFLPHSLRYFQHPESDRHTVGSQPMVVE